MVVVEYVPLVVAAAIVGFADGHAVMGEVNVAVVTEEC